MKTGFLLISTLTLLYFCNASPIGPTVGDIAKRKLLSAWRVLKNTGRAMLETREEAQEEVVGKISKNPLSNDIIDYFIPKHENRAKDIVIVDVNTKNNDGTVLSIEYLFRKSRVAADYLREALKANLPPAPLQLLRTLRSWLSSLVVQIVSYRDYSIPLLLTKLAEIDRTASGKKSTSISRKLFATLMRFLITPLQFFMLLNMKL